MKKRRVIIAVSVTALAVLAFIALHVLSGPPEPVFAGRMLNEWLQLYFPSGSSNGVNSMVAQATEDALNHMGTNALPFLLRKLERHDSGAKRWLIAVINNQSLFKIRLTTDAMDRSRAMLAFYLLGPNAAFALPQLISIYEKSPSPDVQMNIPAILGNMGRAAAPAVPALVKGMANRNDIVRAVTVSALGNIHSHPELTIPALIKALNDPFAPVAMNAAQILGGYGAQARDAVPALVQILKTNQTTNVAPGTWPAARANLGRSAANALKSIDPETAARALSNSVPQQPVKQRP